MELKFFIFRLACAILCGIVIGIERKMRQRSAGLVTNTLVAVGACLFILISESVILASIHSATPEMLANARGGALVNNDNLRVLSQIVTGIGFLGAGVILRDGFTIHGLNSAATLWCAAAVGCLCGYGLWQEALISAVTIALINWILKLVEQFMDKPRKSNPKE